MYDKMSAIKNVSPTIFADKAVNSSREALQRVCSDDKAVVNLEAFSRRYCAFSIFLCNSACSSKHFW